MNRRVFLLMLKTRIAIGRYSTALMTWVGWLVSHQQCHHHRCYHQQDHHWQRRPWQRLGHHKLLEGLESPPPLPEESGLPANLNHEHHRHHHHCLHWNITYFTINLIKISILSINVVKIDVNFQSNFNPPTMLTGIPGLARYTWWKMGCNQKWRSWKNF